MLTKKSAVFHLRQRIFQCNHLQNLFAFMIKKKSPFVNLYCHELPKSTRNKPKGLMIAGSGVLPITKSSSFFFNCYSETIKIEFTYR